MIDVHCHLLPAIDDGAETMDDALALARIAVSNGITHAVMTPHIHPGRYENASANIAAACEAFRQALDDADIPLQIGMAAEVRVSMEIIQMLAAETIPFLGEYKGDKVMLLEFPHGHIIPGTEKLVEYLMTHGIRPLIAHPERNKDVMRDLQRIQPYVEMGCLLQLTASSVAGGFGKLARLRADEMLERGWVTLLASDAHNREHRPPDLQAGRSAAAKIVGDDAAWRMVREIPAAIVQAQFDKPLISG